MCAAAAIVSSSCVVGAPLGFSDGTNWGVPLLGALEDGPLIAPAYINGEGPFLFALNPHSRSVIDSRLAKTLDLDIRRVSRGIVGEKDVVTHEKIDYANINTVRLGNLTVSNPPDFMGIDNDIHYRGWPVQGVIGDDILDDTLIWTIDRDRQMLYLATQGHQTPPPEATRIKAHRVDGGRFFVNVRLDDKKTAYMFADFAHPRTELWPAVANGVALPIVKGFAFTWFGRRVYRDCWKASSVRLGRVRATDMMIYPYDDRRVRERDWDGRLGRNFFARYHVTVNWHKKSVWLAPRSDDLNEHVDERLGRWSNRLDECDAPACITFERRKGTTGQPELWILRDPRTIGTQYEVLVEAMGTDGKPLVLPRLFASFPDSATEVVIAGAGGVVYSSASSLRVVDMSPFPLKCSAADPSRGCASVE